MNKLVKYLPPTHCLLCVSDITYVKCKGGYVFLSLTMDAYSRIITGWSLQRTLATAGPLEALEQTVSSYKRHHLDARGLIFHSDRGSQYVSREMTSYEASLGIITSVTRQAILCIIPWPSDSTIRSRMIGSTTTNFLALRRQEKL